MIGMSRNAATTGDSGAVPMQRLVRLASGPLVMFVAFGFGSWLSGAASWVGVYLGARGRALTGLAQASALAGCIFAVVGVLGWYRGRCLRGRTDIPAAAVLAACAALPIGGVFWAIFVDAIAYHYGRDIVRPAFDDAIMYSVLGAFLPLALGVPLVLACSCRPRLAARQGIVRQLIDPHRDVSGAVPGGVRAVLAEWIGVA